MSSTFAFYSSPVATSRTPLLDTPGLLGCIAVRPVAQSEAKMKHAIFAINITLDGCGGHVKMIADEEVHEHFGDLTRDVDLLVFGLFLA